MLSHRCKNVRWALVKLWKIIGEHYSMYTFCQLFDDFYKMSDTFLNENILPPKWTQQTFILVLIIAECHSHVEIFSVFLSRQNKKKLFVFASSKKCFSVVICLGDLKRLCPNTMESIRGEFLWILRWIFVIKFSIHFRQTVLSVPYDGP